jgi:teichuronic acid biosynthesis glycosyltransferase TuaC
VTTLLRTLLFSTLYPSSARPLHGVFVETRLRELLKTGQVQTRVIAPVPWFWSSHPRWGAYAAMAATPLHEQRDGIEVHHPRYPLPPKIGMTIAPLALALACLPAARRLIASGFDFDLIDAHYYYPDGVAAALLARWLGKPLVVTARGSDLNLLQHHRLPRAMMRWTARRAEASIGVSRALVEVLQGWSIDPARLHVMRNGIDLDRFRPEPPAQARAALGLAGGPLLLSVGNLIGLKGHHLVIDAMPAVLAQHAQARLVIVGQGPDAHQLQAQVQQRGLAGCVTFTGGLPNHLLPRWYSAADALVLASSREGWANVLLEAMACGTPVVATRVGGTPEVVLPASGGVLIDTRDAAAVARGVLQLLAAPPARSRVRRFAEGYGWAQTSRDQLDLFRRLAGHASASSHA